MRAGIGQGFTTFPYLLRIKMPLIVSSLTGEFITLAVVYIKAPAKYIFKVIPILGFSFVTPGRYFVRLHAIATRAHITAVRARYMIAGMFTLDG